jgi:Sulfotransferase domain
VKAWKAFIANLHSGSLKSVLGSGVVHRSEAINLYHCCVPKSGSQWIRQILSDPIAFRYSGLPTFHYESKLPEGYDPRDLIQRNFTEPFPESSIVTPLYISFDNFRGIPKPTRYKAFFIMRDPRDILVSWYFSMRYSHVPLGDIPQLRTTLNSMSFEEGMLYGIDRLNKQGHFRTLASWADSSKLDGNVLVIRFEDLIGVHGIDFFQSLFKHCDIRIPQRTLRQLLAKYSFEALSRRARGEENKEAHYRKGIAGDWKNYFSATITQKFAKVNGDLTARLGYMNDSA